MEKKAGRPTLEHGRKDYTYKIRLDAETLELLNRCAAALNIPRSAFIRSAIKRAAAEQGIK